MGAVCMGPWTDPHLGARFNEEASAGRRIKRDKVVRKRECILEDADVRDIDEHLDQRARE